MKPAEGRTAIPGTPLSVAAEGIWLVPPAAAPLGPGTDTYLLHAASRIQLAIRTLPVGGVFSVADLEGSFVRYAALSWPGKCVASHWTHGARQGVSGVFPEAMPGFVVREWMVTDGEQLANASTFATAQQWDDVLGDFEDLIRSMRFETLDPG
jgi:hypothetical protein